VVGFAAGEDLVFGADPGVVRGVIRKPRGAVAQRAGVRVTGQQVEANGDAQEEGGVAGREEDLDVHALPSPRLGGLRLGDLGEQYVLRLLHRDQRDGVAHAEVAEVQERQHAADDEEDVAR
jgi:hypothetical protein